ncbi:putative SimX4 homolog [Alloactinosynnema sp. L-07]|uniref:metallophosphoesterase family protein n=1 Tax=Alloactinosynnema sp. L-07 TaxID=1653480 RepID=UPI00065EF5E2|nr:metallophosphoesterase [Alloactinosynnema sp. L-07]CRK58278.1 putative SimX4 homolog [Alloactinosynnema sp. L-07]
MGSLLAISDLHITYAENREIVAGLRPESPDDWLLVAGDVADQLHDVRWALETLAGRFAKVIWTPGNHELWTVRADPVQSLGVQRYEDLVAMCRELGVLTPEDPYVQWTGEGGPVLIAPLFIGYDYTFNAPGCTTKEESLAYARDTGIVCTDEVYLSPDPYESRDDWCRARVALTEARLAECDPAVPLVLVNHYPLVREPTRILRFPEFAQWCGTVLTADWHTRFNTAAMVYGHLHIPRITHHDGVRFQEVSLGYPREWRRHGNPHGILRRVLTAPARV